MDWITTSVIKTDPDFHSGPNLRNGSRPDGAQAGWPKCDFVDAVIRCVANSLRLPSLPAALWRCCVSGRPNFGTPPR
jgi:hypothetical protein